MRLGFRNASEGLFVGFKVGALVVPSHACSRFAFSKSKLASENQYNLFLKNSLERHRTHFEIPSSRASSFGFEYLDFF